MGIEKKVVPCKKNGESAQETERMHKIVGGREKKKLIGTFKDVRTHGK